MEQDNLRRSKMKKLIVLILAGIIIFPAVIFATNMTTTISSAVYNASFTPTGGVQQWDATLRLRSTNAIATAITWPATTAGSPGYKIADQYITLTCTITTTNNWRMNIYTDNTKVVGGFYPYYTVNKVAMADQAAACSTASVKSFGLVGQANPTSTDENINGTCYGLPLAWMVLDNSSATPATPVFAMRTATVGGFTNYMWKFVLDKGRANVGGAVGSAWNSADPYVRVWDQAGYYWSEDPTKAGPSDDNKIYIYLAVETTQSKAQTYTTKTLTIDALQL